jgi:putative endonuclease
MLGDFLVYIVTNPNKSVLYTGMTNNLEARLIEHWLNKGYSKTFAGRYFCYNLLYFELHEYPQDAIDREKEIKSWNRNKKEALITEFNPNWKFLNDEVMDWPPPKNATSRS